MIPPYEYSDAERTLIEATQIKVGSPDCWSDHDVDPVKLSLKRYYVDAQDHICAYCRKLYDVAHLGSWTLDHIIPRSEYPDFTFAPSNLVAACYDCNTFKSDSPVLVGARRVRVPPRTSQRYRICHPYLDIYANHIVKHGEFFYNSRSTKGDYTIYICRLSRFLSRQLGFDVDSMDDAYYAMIGQLYVGDLEARLYAGEMLVAHLRAKRNEQLMREAAANLAQQNAGAQLQIVANAPPPALPPPQDDA